MLYSRKLLRIESGFVRAFAVFVLAMMLAYVSIETAGESIVVQAEEIKAENIDTKANVKIVKEIRYHRDGSIRLVYIDTYDEEDRLLERVQYDGDGNIIGQTVLQIVDDTFEIVFWGEYVNGETYKTYKRQNTIYGESAGENGPYQEKYAFPEKAWHRYNQQGVLYETRYQVPKYTYWTTSYEYDTQGRIASTESYVVWESLHDVKSRAVYYYDDQNKLVKILDDVAESQTYFTYNEKGDLTEEITYVQDGKVLYVKVYTYETR